MENMPMVDRDSYPYDKQWEESKNVLNNTEKEPQKNVKEWKKVFRELKTNVRGREVKVDLNRTDGGTSKVKPLTEVEEKVLSSISKVTVEGAEAVVEFGICNEEETNRVESLVEVSDLNNVILEEVSRLPSSPSTSRLKKTPVNRRKKRQINQKTMLETAVERQAEASQALAASTINLSSSIRFLAESISEAISQ